MALKPGDWVVIDTFPEELSEFYGSFEISRVKKWIRHHNKLVVMKKTSKDTYLINLPKSDFGGVELTESECIRTEPSEYFKKCKTIEEIIVRAMRYSKMRHMPSTRIRKS